MRCPDTLFGACNWSPCSEIAMSLLALELMELRAVHLFVLSMQFCSSNHSVIARKLYVPSLVTTEGVAPFVMFVPACGFLDDK